jgi:acetate kinase
VAVVTRVLVVNAGSTSLKLRVLSPDGSVTGSADLRARRGEADAASVKAALAGFGDVGAVGHRIVHGGDIFSGPVLIDARIRQRLGALTDLAPLHQPKSLAAVDAVQTMLPEVPAVMHPPDVTARKPRSPRCTRSGRCARLLVVESGLQDHEVVAVHEVDQPVFLTDPA